MNGYNKKFRLCRIWKEEVMESMTVPYFFLKEEETCEKPPVLRQGFKTRTWIAQLV
jgi:hypothetical protein